MKVGISTAMFWKSPENIVAYLKLIAGCGFTTLELDCHNLFKHLSEALIDRLSECAAGNGLSVSSLHLPYFHPLVWPDEKVRALAIGNIVSVARRVALRLHEKWPDQPVPTLVFHPGIRLEKQPREKQMEGFEKGMDKLKEDLPDGVFTLAFENMLSSHFGSTPEEMDFIFRAAAAAFPKSRIGLCFDSCHSSYDFLSHEFLENIREPVVATHISDNFLQPHGEFHAIPFTLIHSKIEWPRLVSFLAHRLDAIILELDKPPYISYEAYLKMARTAAIELERFGNAPCAKVTP